MFIRMDGWINVMVDGGKLAKLEYLIESHLEWDDLGRNSQSGQFMGT